MPLSDELRPVSIDDVVGQSHIIGEGKLINRMIDKKNYSNMIFFGPPGIGKTTVAEIMSRESNMEFFKINATNSGIDEIKKVISKVGSLETSRGILLYIDEIQYYNKRQQQTLLEFIESGDIVLIASTTENPYHHIYKAILSRSVIMEFKPLSSNEVKIGLKKCINRYNRRGISKIVADEELLDRIAGVTDGDMRSAINMLEMTMNISNLDSDGNIHMKRDDFDSLGISTMYNFDTSSDVHYNLLSAFQKSIRGSDIDAAIYYLARLVKGGDLISICRRLLVIACEDIGLAYPSAISIVKSCVDAAERVGFPEARIILAHATIVLAGAPKSNSGYMAIDVALSDIDSMHQDDIPKHLKDAHYSGAMNLGHGIEYKYPHSYPNHYVEQQYLPDNKVGSVYYTPQSNKFEEGIRKYIEYIKGIK